LSEKLQLTVMLLLLCVCWVKKKIDFVLIKETVAKEEKIIL